MRNLPRRLTPCEGPVVLTAWPDVCAYGGADSERWAGTEASDEWDPPGREAPPPLVTTKPLSGLLVFDEGSARLD